MYIFECYSCMYLGLIIQTLSFTSNEFRNICSCIQQLRTCILRYIHRCLGCVHFIQDQIAHIFQLRIINQKLCPERYAIDIYSKLSSLLAFILIFHSFLPFCSLPLIFVSIWYQKSAYLVNK